MTAEAGGELIPLQRTDVRGGDAPRPMDRRGIGLQWDWLG
jgi:hypothetical protein